MTVKPAHNKFDNIYEIRQTGYPTEDLINETLTSTSPFKRSRRIGKTRIFDDAHHFIHTIVRNFKEGIKMPVWKVVIPRLNDNTGSIYYIVQTQKVNLIFRGTFGYFGTGPHESALIEAIFEKLNFTIEVRDGDYLLSFL